VTGDGLTDPAVMRNVLLLVIGSLTTDQAMMNQALEGDSPGLLAALLLGMIGYVQFQAIELHGSREAAVTAIRGELANIKV
jgi:hypothetical protein